MLALVATLASGCGGGSPSAPECAGPYAEDFPGLEAPNKIRFPSPMYPEEARRARTTGLVTVEGIVACDGSYTALRVVKSLPNGLDQAVLDILPQWRFEPARLDGVPVSAILSVSFNFQLQ